MKLELSGRERLRLRPIEVSWELMNVARESGIHSSYYLSSMDLYALHGRPFGSSNRAIGIWLACEQATTVN